MDNKGFLVITDIIGYQKGVLDIDISVSERYNLRYDAMEGVIGGSNSSFLFLVQFIVVSKTYVDSKSCVVLLMKTHINRMGNCAPKWLTFFHHTNLRSIFSPQSEGSTYFRHVGCQCTNH